MLPVVELGETERMIGVKVDVWRGFAIAAGRGLLGWVVRNRSDRGCLDLLW